MDSTLFLKIILVHNIAAVFPFAKLQLCSFIEHLSNRPFYLSDVLLFLRRNGNYPLKVEQLGGAQLFRAVGGEV